MLEWLHRHLCENGSFIASSDGRTGTRTVRHPNIEETILNIADETPHISTRAIARRVHECTGSICMAYGLESCQCIRSYHDPLTRSCELCCKLPGDELSCK
ncbi:hypothetical protein AVEN_16027-1 [Araneus ventricosus]|uniref:Uncharacterized protein n=1 Tax=Araneus ventricosus TaxID=182803 RepID=A0A4Y2FFH2_ARAVE|nr:hypothetical protein AVEN_16027-1 [Araneus ventricosus]